MNGYKNVSYLSKVKMPYTLTFCFLKAHFFKKTEKIPAILVPLYEIFFGSLLNRDLHFVTAGLSGLVLQNS